MISNHISYDIFQQLLRNKTAFQFLNSSAGGWKVNRSLQLLKNILRSEQNWTFYLSVLNLFRWMWSIIHDTVRLSIILRSYQNIEVLLRLTGMLAVILFTHKQTFNWLVFLFSRTLMSGDKKAGFTIFWADDGLDTGRILSVWPVAVVLNIPCVSYSISNSTVWSSWQQPILA